MRTCRTYNRVKRMGRYVGIELVWWGTVWCNKLVTLDPVRESLIHNCNLVMSK